MPPRSVRCCSTLLALLLISCASTSAWAAPDGALPPTEEPTGLLTLDDALRVALARSPSLGAASWSVRASEALTRQARLIPNPSLEAESEEIDGLGAGAFDAAATTIAVAQPLELGGKRSRRTRAAEVAERLASRDYDAARLAVKAATTTAFVEVLAAQERLRLSEELLELSQRLVDAVALRVEAGKVSPVESTRASITLIGSRIERDKVRRSLEAARARLSATWGSPAPRFERAEGSLEVGPLPIPSRAELESLALEAPDVARWADELDQRRAALDVEKAARIPDLDVVAGVQRFEETGDGTILLGIGLALPLFNRNQGAILAAHHEIARAVEEQRRATAEGLTAVASTYEELSAAHAAAIALSGEVLPAATKAFESVTEAYRAGKVPLLDLLDAQRTLFETRGQEIEALVSYRLLLAELERLVGRGLEDGGVAPTADRGEEVENDHAQ